MSQTHNNRHRLLCAYLSSIIPLSHCRCASFIAIHPIHTYHYVVVVFVLPSSTTTTSPSSIHLGGDDSLCLLSLPRSYSVPCIPVRHQSRPSIHPASRVSQPVSHLLGKLHRITMGRVYIVLVAGCCCCCCVCEL